MGVFEGYHPVARRGIILKRFNLPCFSVIVPVHCQHANQFSPAEILLVKHLSGSLKLSVNSNSLQMENFSQIMVMLHHGGKFVVFFMFSHPKYYKIYAFYSLWLNLKRTSEERDRFFQGQCSGLRLNKLIFLLQGWREHLSAV